MFSEKCERAIQKAFKLMEEECPVYVTGEDFLNSKATKNFWKLRLANRKNEQFDILFLNNQHQQLACETLFKGTIDAASVHPRVVIQRILHHNAAAVILGHNHPSGISLPSIADKKITDKLKSACAAIDVRVLDHIIVGTDIYSFSESGDM